MLMLIITLSIPALVVLIFKFLNAETKPPIFGIYQIGNKNYWFKLIFLYTILKFKQLYHHLKRLFDVEFGRSEDGIEHIHKKDLSLEQKYFLGDNPKAIDAVYFNGMSQNGDYVVCNIARRAGQICDSFLILKVEGEDMLLSPLFPDTYQIQHASEMGEYQVEGLNIQNIVPMRAWSVSYNGEMKLAKGAEEKRVKVALQLIWSSHFNPFNYDTDMCASSMASDIAKEQWTTNYFKLLKKFHQTHYEQMGFFKGTVDIDGRKHEINMPCVRDHSFGPFRDWRTFHRYVYHFLYLENGDCMAIGAVSQPAILSHLTIGYYCRQSDQSVHAIQSTEFQLYQHGESQVMPKDYGFAFKTAGRLHYLKVLVDNEEYFYVGKDRLSKIYERWSKVEVDGVKGWGCVEWQYNNLKEPKDYI